MSEPAPVRQTLPFEVGVIRWWQSRVNLVQIWSIFSEGWLPVLLLFDFTQIGLSVKAAAVIAIVLKLLNASSSIYLRNIGNDVVGNKVDVAVADAAPAPVSVPTPPGVTT